MFEGPTNCEELSDLASHMGQVSKEVFLSQFSEPFLVVEMSQTGEARDFRTMSTADDTRKTQPGAKRMDAENVTSHVHIIRKSDRNAFQAMVTLGRASNNDIVVEHPCVSKFHAVFKRNPAEKQHAYVDVGSTNGSFFRGAHLGQNTAVPLASGDAVNLGGAVLATYFTPSEFFDYVELLRRTGKL